MRRPWRRIEVLSRRPIMSITLPNSTLTPAAAYPSSPYLVAEPLAWTGARRPAIILVASDGTERSDGALRVALARAERTNAALEVLTIARWEPIGGPEGMVLWQESIAERRGEQRRVVEAQLERITGKPRVHGVTVLDGNPAYTISRVAIDRRAALVVVGLGRHGLSDRLFSDETAVELARISRVPVLAVPEFAVGAGGHAVVAVDFADLSDRAAQAAIDAVGDGGIVELVHVMPYVSEDPFAVESEEPYARWTNAHLEALTKRLVIPPGVTVSRVALRGRAAGTLLEYAQTSGADFIATGTHGRGFVARTLLGSVATSLLRGAKCGVLSVPRDPLPALAVANPGALAQPTAIWIDMLSTFSKRNLGRRTILEVDDLELGAQAQEYNYPLLGAVYDERAGRLELMLGDTTAGGRHLTRSIGAVRAVDILTDGAGRDVALRVQHGTSQTLLTFAA
jgi:nucleotide-binding universal stress UspA family protein